MSRLKIALCLMVAAGVLTSSVNVHAEDVISAPVQALSEKMWTEAKASLTVLGVADVDSYKEKYIKSTARVLKRVEALAEDKKALLLKADKPLTAIHTQNINKGLKGAQKIFAPGVTGYVKSSSNAAVVTPDEAVKILASLEGKWVNDWTSAKEKRTWVIDKTGQVKEDYVRRGKPQDSKDISLTLKKANRISVKKGTSSQTYVFFKTGNKFYMSSNTLYDVFPLTDRANFMVKNKRDYVVFKGGACSVVTEGGAEVKATCSFEKTSTGESFKVAYQFAGEVNHMDKPETHSFQFEVEGDHLLSEDLVVSGQFVKK